MSANFKYDVFLSHNAADKPRVRQLAEKLKEAGLSVWFDEWNIKPGDIISLKVDEGLEQSRALLLCITLAALSSNWVALESSTAMHRDPSNENRRFLPLLLEECDLPDTLRRYKFIDYREASTTAFKEILAACNIVPDVNMLPVKNTEAKLQSSLVKPIKKKQSDNAPKKTQPNKKSESKNQPIATLEKSLNGHEGPVNSIAISPDGKWAVSGSDDKTVRTWDLEIGECSSVFEKHTGDVTCVAISPDGKKIFSGSWDRSIYQWSPKKKKEEVFLKDLPHKVISIAVSGDGTTLVSGDQVDTTIRIWDIETKEAITAIKDTSIKIIWSIALWEVGKAIISAGGDTNVKIWNIETGTLLATLSGHKNMIKSVKLIPNSDYAVSGSKDTTIRIWDLRAKTCIGTLEGHRGQIDSVDVSPDGKLVASTGFTDFTVRLWDWYSGECKQIITLEELPTSVAFSPDGSRLLVGTYKGTIYSYWLSQVIVHSPTTHRYVNAKVVLLGEGTVGKTSLAHRLIKDEYVIADRTHGMNVWPLNIPLPPDETIEREALLWDLAGQEDYRLIHRLFLDETALALLLINPQKNDPFVEAGDWLKTLQTTGKDRNKLLIFSQVDVGEPKLGSAKIREFCAQQGFADYLLTSAKNGRNCSDIGNGNNPSALKQLIADNIPWHTLPWTSTPRLLAELKKAILAMLDGQDIRLLRFAELAQRLEQALPNEQFGESDIRTAVTLLANHGLAKPLTFGDLVLLQPQLLNGYAGAIIRAARAHTDEIGAVSEAHIYSDKFDFTGVDRLAHRPDEELLLRALVETLLHHSLCIAEETLHGKQLVFPSQYRREKDLPNEPDTFVSYTFSGEWQTIWTTLVVQLWYSSEFKHRELWRNAAEFASAKGHTLGLKISNKQGEGTATVSLYFDKEVSEDLMALFIEYVHRHLAKFGCEVTRDRRYQCPSCGKPVTDIDAVRKRLELKKDFITCQQCDEKVPLIDFIEQRLKSDPVARKILAMEEIATRQLDNQALEQILIGHMMAISGEANQIFRPTTMFDYGIDGEVEFKDDNGKASGRKIYIQLKSGNSYLRTRKKDGTEIFDITNDHHLQYWVSQPVDVYLVIRQTDEITNQQTIRWMNVTQYLKNRKATDSRQVIFSGEKLDTNAIWKVRDPFFPRSQNKKR